MVSCPPCRATAFTALNAHSSRSHAVVMLTVVKRKSAAAGTDGAEIQRVGGRGRQGRPYHLHALRLHCACVGGQQGKLWGGERQPKVMGSAAVMQR